MLFRKFASFRVNTASGTRDFLFFSHVVIKGEETHPSMASSIFFFLSSMSSGVSMPAGTDEKPPGVISPLDTNSRHSELTGDQPHRHSPPPTAHCTCLQA